MFFLGFFWFYVQVGIFVRVYGAFFAPGRDEHLESPYESFVRTIHTSAVLFDCSTV